MHPNAAQVVETAATRGLSIEVSEFPDGTRTAEDAAAAIGCTLGQIVKSLVFVVDGEPVVALMSGPNRLDETKLADAVVSVSSTSGGHDRAEGKVTRADADLVRSATGFPIGGVPPFGHTAGLRCLVDEDLLGYDVVWAAAGTPRSVFPIKPPDLVRLAAATPANLSS